MILKESFIFWILLGMVMAVAQGLIGAFAAAAQRYAVTHFIGLTVRGFHPDTAPDPDGAEAAAFRVLDEADGRGEMRFDWIVFVIPGYQPSGRTIAGFLDGHLFVGGLIRMFREVPGAFAAVAKARPGT